MANRFLIPAIAAVISITCGGGWAVASGGREPVVGLPCEGCESVFDGLPSKLSPIARIAPVREPGQPMRIVGTVRNAQGRPVAGVIVYAYQTNARGIYPTRGAGSGRASHRHGLLRGWARTDALGHYRFDTIRPAGYPNTDIPQHVHMHVIEPGCCTYYVDDIHFSDDPRLRAAAARGETVPGRGGSGIVTPRRDAAGRWLVTRDIVVGLNIPGYADASGRR